MKFNVYRLNGAFDVFTTEEGENLNTILEYFGDVNYITNAYGNVVWSRESN